MGHYELISACFFGKLALIKSLFEVHTPKFADPPIVHTCCEIFLQFFFGGFPKLDIFPPAGFLSAPLKYFKTFQQERISSLK